MIRLNKHIYLFIFCFFLYSYGISQTASNCELSVFYNKPTDEKTKTAIKSSDFNISGFNDVLVAYFNDMHIKIDVVFFDVTQHFGLRMKGETKHNLANEYAESWKTEYSSEERILMLFKKETESGEYVFNDFEVTNNVGSRQLFPVVTKYIEEQILKDDATHKTNKEKISAGINACKNAFDQQFKNRLISESADMVQDEKYKKGTVLRDWNFFYFEPYYIELNLYYDKDGEVLELYMENEQKAKTSDYYLQEKFYYNNSEGQKTEILKSDEYLNIRISRKELLDIKPHYNIPASREYLTIEWANKRINEITQEDNSETLESFKRDHFVFEDKKYSSMDDLKTKYANVDYWTEQLYSNTYHFQKWVSTKYENGKKVKQHFDFSDYKRTILTKTYVVTGDMKNRYGELSYPTELGFSNFGGIYYSDYGFTEAKLTYCDIFARDLFCKVYNNIDSERYSSEQTTGNFQNDLQKLKGFVDISYIEGGSNTVWSVKTKNKIKLLVDAGYWINYYKIADHIETCFPENDDYFSVGGGSSVGYRKAEMKFLNNNSNNTPRGVKILLYLEYLKYEVK